MARREEEVRASAREIFARERLGQLLLGGPLLAVLFAGSWGRFARTAPDTWSIGMILAGFFVGATVRLLGRGTRPIFYLASLTLYLATLVFASALFGVLSEAFVAIKLLIVVVGIGISASLGLVSFGLSREERWTLRDNRGFAEPETPGGLLGGTLAPLGALFAACGLAALLAGVVVSYVGRFTPEEYPIFGEPSVEYWEAALERDAELVEEARKNGVGLGLDGSDEACRAAVEARDADCELNLCKAQGPYVLAGCLETAKAVREDAPIRW